MCVEGGVSSFAVYTGPLPDVVIVQIDMRKRHAMRQYRGRALTQDHSPLRCVLPVVSLLVISPGAEAPPGTVFLLYRPVRQVESPAEPWKPGPGG